MSVNRYRILSASCSVLSISMLLVSSMTVAVAADNSEKAVMPMSVTTPYAISNIAMNGHIDGLIRYAVDSHPLVGSARAEQQATTESIRAAKLNLLPAPTLSSGYDRDDGMVSRFQLRQSLWTGGKLTANVNQALFDDKAATEYIYEQQNQTPIFTKSPSKNFFRYLPCTYYEH